MTECNAVVAAPGNPAFTLDTVFKTRLQPLLTLPATELTTPPPPEIQGEGSSSTKTDDQQLQPEAERKGSKVRRQLFEEEHPTQKKPKED
nr:hypothetical protein [Tanacetum cinerariifolium]